MINTTHTLVTPEAFILPAWNTTIFSTKLWWTRGLPDNPIYFIILCNEINRKIVLEVNKNASLGLGQFFQNADLQWKNTASPKVIGIL